MLIGYRGEGGGAFSRLQRCLGGLGADVVLPQRNRTAEWYACLRADGNCASHFASASNCEMGFSAQQQNDHPCEGFLIKLPSAHATMMLGDPHLYFQLQDSLRLQLNLRSLYLGAAATWSSSAAFQDMSGVRAFTLQQACQKHLCFSLHSPFSSEGLMGLGLCVPISSCLHCYPSLLPGGHYSKGPCPAPQSCPHLASLQMHPTSTNKWAHNY